ncbi:hypothetical protein DFH11DRAFT_958813 [Phellopilus nigrolimitatus]|nr:hypothetical protein DFH11DRAFT_958813 [Phellopilus nigrolimitatus]
MSIVEGPFKVVRLFLSSFTAVVLLSNTPFTLFLMDITITSSYTHEINGLPKDSHISGPLHRLLASKDRMAGGVSYQIGRSASQRRRATAVCSIRVPQGGAEVETRAHDFLRPACVILVH